MADAAAAKQVLRAQLRRARRQLDPATAERETVATVDAARELIARLRPAAVASYLAVAPELALDALHRALWAAGTRVWLPRVAGERRLAWHALRGDDRLVPGRYGILEPDPAATSAAPLPDGVLVLVPGLGFGIDGRRLGQNGGYYDTALPTVRGFAVGVGYTCQRADDLPEEPHDRRMDGVLLGGVLVKDPGPGPIVAR